MAEKKGAGTESGVTGDTAAKKSAPKKGARTESGVTGDMAAKKSAPKKGARTATDPKAAGTTRTAKAGGTTKEGGASRTGSTAKASGNGPARAAAGTRAAGKKSAPDLRKDLRDFAGARPDGWGHEDWLKFLEDLQTRGHNINDRDAIGSMLERERLALALERIPGVGPQRVRSIADRYGYLWRLRETDADQLAREANVPKNVAEKVLDALRR